MIINLSNPLYNTVIVFVSIMALLYIIKPDAIYDNQRKEFRQFGVDDGKTLLPIYVVGILLAIILYVLFNQLAKLTVENSSKNSDQNRSHSYDFAESDRSSKTDIDSELSSLKTQIKMMNQTIAQMNQMSQMNQMNQINQMNQQLSQMKMRELALSQRSHSDLSSGGGRGINNHNSRYDRAGIYRHQISSDGSNGSDRSILSNRSTRANSIDADGIVDSVLASARPSHTYTNTNSHSQKSAESMHKFRSNQAILPNNYSV
jgi:TolA-binding protein